MTRFFDILLSGLAIAALSPLLIPVMIILRLTGEGEVFYLQERIGKGKKAFYVLKFATMLKESPNLSGGCVTKKHDPRVLPFGSYLRKTKVNELPQLFNIFLGRMSIVGPRPLTPGQFENYSEEQQAKIATMTPGLTGIGSLIFRNEEEILEKSGMDYRIFHSEVIAPYKGDLECWYSKNRSLGLYFKIITLTALAVVWPNGKYREAFKELPQPTGTLADLI